MSDPTHKISQAVSACLHRCYAEPSPFSAVIVCLDELRQQPDWTEAEVLQVERTVLRMLRAMVDAGATPPSELNDTMPPNPPG